MKMILKRDWLLTDASSGKAVNTTLPSGTHEVERIPNPFGSPNDPWLVLVGTKKGATEISLMKWENGKIIDNPGSPSHGELTDWGEFEIIIED